MKKLVNAAILTSVFVSATALAHPVSHPFEPKSGVEAYSYGTGFTYPNRYQHDDFYRTLLGVVIPGVGKEVNMLDLVPPEVAAAAYASPPIPGTWRQINPDVGVETYLNEYD